MTQGLLAKCFTGVAIKRLRAVEASPHKSNQHEFNGVVALKQLLGTEDRKGIQTQFLWIGGEQEAISEDGFMTWYQSRKPPRDEYRLYFKTTTVMEMASEGDAVFFGTCPDGSMMVILSPANSTMENQLAWLFGVREQLELQFIYEEVQNDSRADSDFATRYILEELGLEPEEPETGHLDLMLERFGGKLPDTRIFSEFARSTLDDVSATDNPDSVLMTWMEREEVLFRRMERHILENQLKDGFASIDGIDVDSFIDLSRSVLNRRMVRAGLAFENHLEAIFALYNIQNTRGKKTEDNSRPDFLFPSVEAYNDQVFPIESLVMLGAKTTCKDRWRQVLAEAARIEHKHLITLEPGISENQTNEMQAMKLQLVLPTALHTTYRSAQLNWLMNLEEFLGHVKERNAKNSYAQNLF